MWFGATVFGNSVKIFPFETGLINVTTQAQEVMNPNRNEQYANKYKASGWGGGMFKHYFFMIDFMIDSTATEKWVGSLITVRTGFQ